MWLNAFTAGDKALSPVELLVLTSVPNDPKTPKDITNILGKTDLQWYPASGSLYPILHRLVDLGLLKKIGEKRFRFSKTNHGNQFLASNIRNLRMQIKENLAYNLVVLESIFNIEPKPTDLEMVFRDIENYLTKFQQKLKEFHSASKKIVDESVDVPIKFE